MLVRSLPASEPACRVPPRYLRNTDTALSRYQVGLQVRRSAATLLLLADQLPSSGSVGRANALVQELVRAFDRLTVLKENRTPRLLLYAIG